MKIVPREVFLAMPSGTLFSKYRPSYFEALTIKGDTWGNDFLEQQIAEAAEADSGDRLSDILDDAVESGSSFDMDFDCMGRDGCFEGSETMFAVWEAKDVRALIARLQDALQESTSATPPPAADAVTDIPRNSVPSTPPT